MPSFSPSLPSATQSVLSLCQTSPKTPYPKSRCVFQSVLVRGRTRCGFLPRCCRTKSPLHIHHAESPGDYTPLVPRCSVREEKLACHHRRHGSENNVAIIHRDKTLHHSRLRDIAFERIDPSYTDDLPSRLSFERTSTRSCPGTCATQTSRPLDFVVAENLSPLE